MTDICLDCGLPLAPERKTRGSRVDPTLCAARFSTHYELQCKRVAVPRLLARVEAVRVAVEWARTDKAQYSANFYDVLVNLIEELEGK